MIAPFATLVPALLPLHSSDAPTLRIDPRLILEAREVFETLSAPGEPLWPDWNIAETPLLFYFPGVQDVLIGHPAPPADFVRYEGPIQFGDAEIRVRDGATLFDLDGQNTKRDVAGVTTLVVADTLSNQRNNLRALVQSRPGARQLEDALSLRALAADPYGQMGMIAHEAFHVQQEEWQQPVAYSELDILEYPVLDAANNVGLALEARELDAALGALEQGDQALFEEAALRWLAVRTERRAGLPERAVVYEDGIEQNEGVAKYIEYALSQRLEGRTPGTGMEWVRGFHGYADLGDVRAELRRALVGFLTGERIVNGDPYGTGAVRFRCYYSGMAIGVLLDQFDPAWKEVVGQDGRALTQFVADALYASPDELAAALEEARAAVDFDALTREKEELRRAGSRVARERVASITGGEGSRVWIDYGALGSEDVGWAFTPFGVTVVDAERKIYGQIPVRAAFPGGSELAQTLASPVLHDAGRRRVCFALEAAWPRELVDELAVEAELSERTLRLDGAEIRVQRGRARIEGGVLFVELLP